MDRIFVLYFLFLYILLLKKHPNLYFIINYLFYLKNLFIYKHIKNNKNTKQMDLIIKEFDAVYEQKINQIINEYKRLEGIIAQSSIESNQLKEENNLLKKKIADLNDEKKTKSSSVLWETTQKQLGEKDQIIEQLKKDVEFYKRQSVLEQNLM